MAQLRIVLRDCTEIGLIVSYLVSRLQTNNVDLDTLVELLDSTVCSIQLSIDFGLTSCVGFHPHFESQYELIQILDLHLTDLKSSLQAAAELIPAEESESKDMMMYLLDFAKYVCGKRGIV